MLVLVMFPGRQRQHVCMAVVLILIQAVTIRFIILNRTLLRSHARRRIGMAYYSPGALLGLWLRLECSFDSLSIDPAHVIYLAEGHNVGSERQSSVMTLRKPIVTWII